MAGNDNMIADTAFRLAIRTNSGHTAGGIGIKPLLIDGGSHRAGTVNRGIGKIREGYRARRYPRQDGIVKSTYGTGCFLLMNTGSEPKVSDNGLVTTIAWGYKGEITYALEGSVFVAGSAIQWLRDELRFLESAGDSEYMAKKVNDTNGCYIVPAFTGLGAPYWDAYARGAIVGLTRGVNKYHIVRATLDSMAYQVNDVLSAMEADSGIKLSALKVDGGAAANNYLMQSQADICGAPVLRPKCVETTAMGAAYLAGLCVGYWKDQQDIQQNWSVDRRFSPEIDPHVRADLLSGWQKAVSTASGWCK